MASQSSEILLLSLTYRSFLDSTYSSLIEGLSKAAQLKRAKSASGAIRYLEERNPKAIIITDEGLGEAENRAVLEKVKAYAGGFGLPWKRGDYYRTTFRFYPSCTLPAGVVKDKMTLEYSMKVLHIRNAKQHEKIFLLLPGGTTQSLVFPPSHVDEAQAAVVGGKVGDGFLVYCGDVNGEEGSDKVILALCGL